MKRFNKTLALIIVLSLAFCALCLPVSAASTGARGETVTITTSVKNVCGISGTVSFSGSDIFSNVDISVTDSQLIANNKFYVNTSLTPKTYTVTVKLTIKSTASVGDICNVIISGESVDQDGSMGTFSETTLVQVVAASSAVVVDYSKLNAQIATANGLSKADYTSESWTAMLAALSEAKSLLKSTSQIRVDNGANKLEAAIAALVKIDRTALIAAIESAQKLFDTNDDTKAWKDFVDAVNKANEMLTSNVQADVDSAANALVAAVKALTEIINREPEKIVETVEVTKEVEKIVEVTKEVEKIVEVEKTVEVTVEVPTDPTEPFCNKTSHTVWLVLLIISAIINVVFIVLTVVYFTRKKNNHKDTTPLVNYSIEDDNK